MRALLAAATVAAVLLAGCSDGEAADAGLPDDAAPSATGSSSAAQTVQARPWTAEDVPVSMDGNLGTRAHACVFPAAACPGHDVVADVTDLIVERPGANFTGIDVTLTWTAQSPATAQLGLGYMIMETCEGCSNHTFYPVVEGPSPLQLTLSGANEALTADRVVHVYVYNTVGLVYDPNVPGYAFASVDQAFRIEGTVSLLVPPA